MSKLRTLKASAPGFALLMLLSLAVLQGCSGTKTFHQVARGGDTIAIASGYKENFSRDNITVYVYPNDGTGTFLTFAPNHSSIRAVVNFYPDPISSLVVSRRTQQNITPFSETYAGTTDGFAGDQHDWFNTVVFFDLPTGLPAGPTSIYLDNPEGEFVDTEVEIVAGTGKKNIFEANTAGALDRAKLSVLERAAFYKVSFSGTTLPHAIQLDLTHDADLNADPVNGIGKAYAVDPISGIKNISWSDDGTSMRVIITPTEASLLNRFSDFSFYIAGGIMNLADAGVTAYGIDGTPVSGVAVTVEANNIVISSN